MTTKPPPSKKAMTITYFIGALICIAFAVLILKPGNKPNPFDYSSITDCQVLLQSKAQLEAQHDKVNQQDLDATNKRLKELNCK